MLRCIQIFSHLGLPNLLCVEDEYILTDQPNFFLSKLSTKFLCLYLESLLHSYCLSECQCLLSRSYQAYAMRHISWDVSHYFMKYVSFLLSWDKFHENAIKMKFTWDFISLTKTPACLSYSMTLWRCNEEEPVGKHVTWMCLPITLMIECLLLQAKPSSSTPITSLGCLSSWRSLA